MVDELNPPLSIPRSEMFKAAPAASGDDIAAALRSSTPPKAGETTKRRGRPPGSKNRTPAERLAATTQDAATIARAKAERIKKDADEMALWITEELNEHIMTLVMQIPGMTPEMLYKEGYAPPTTAHISKYTDLGNALAIPPSLAKSAARLAAEAKATDQGASLTGKVSVGKAGLIVAGIGTLFGTFQYASGVNKVLARAKEAAEARAEWEARTAVTDEGQHTTSEAERMRAGGLVG